MESDLANKNNVFYLTKDDWDSTTEKLDSVKGDLEIMKTYIPHLEKLDALPQIRDHLINVATGKDHVPKTIVDSLLEKQNKLAMGMHKILTAIIIGLVLIIGVLLTGKHFGLVSLFQ